MPVIDSPKLQQASIYTDLNSLDHIRQQAQVDEIGAIKKAAKEFEAFFMNMMLKSMRQASDVIGSDSPFYSQQEKMYVSMLDQQMSVELSQDGHLRIADMMVEQLTRQYQKSKDSLPTDYHLNKIKGSSVVAEQALIDEKQSKDKIEKLIQVSQDLQQQVENAFVRAEVDPITTTQVKQKQAHPFLVSNHVKPQVESMSEVKPSKRPMFERIGDFIDELMPHAVEAAKTLNLDPRLLIAQAALETGWGKFVMHDEKGKPGFNLFGIKSNKSWQGESIQIDTLEVENTEFKKVNASFRKYDSYAESFSDYVDFIMGNPRYKKAVEAAPDASAYANALQESGYATDPNYAQKILRIFQDQQVQSASVGLK